MQLPESVLDLHLGLPKSLLQAPVRLLSIKALLGWSKLKAYEEVDVDDEAVMLAYTGIHEDAWASTLCISWRWSA